MEDCSRASTRKIFAFNTKVCSKMFFSHEDLKLDEVEKCLFLERKKKNFINCKEMVVLDSFQRLLAAIFRTEKFILPHNIRSLFSRVYVKSVFL